MKTGRSGLVVSIRAVSAVLLLAGLASSQMSGDWSLPRTAGKSGVPASTGVPVAPPPSLAGGGGDTSAGADQSDSTAASAVSFRAAPPAERRFYYFLLNPRGGTMTLLGWVFVADGRVQRYWVMRPNGLVLAQPMAVVVVQA